MKWPLHRTSILRLSDSVDCAPSVASDRTSPLHADTSHKDASRFSQPIAPYIRNRPNRPSYEWREQMQAHWPQQPDDALRHRDVQAMTEAGLDRAIRLGMDGWCDLLDDLLNTGGMLPSRDLAGRVVSFFEDEYWRAEDARIEALRRQMLSRRRCRGVDRSRGIR